MPPRKAATVSKSKSAGARRGKNAAPFDLERLFTIPRELLLEIVSYLTPLDLIHLGRVSHAFRAHFLVRASKPLWKAARSGMALIPGCPGLPECPQDVSEPAYANLVFGKICEACEMTNAQVVSWVLQTRMCRSCHNENVMSGHAALHHNYRELSWSKEELARLWTMLPAERLDDRFPEEQLDNESWDKYYVPTLKWAIRQYGRLYDDGKKQALMEFIQARRARSREQEAMGARLKKFGEWLKKQEEDRKNGIMKQRERDIEQRLIALGWKKTYFPRFVGGSLGYNWHVLVDVAKPITDRTFKTILPKLEDCLRENKSIIDRHEYRKRLGYRKAEAKSSYPRYIADLVADAKSAVSAEDVIWYPTSGDLVECSLFISTLEDEDATREITSQWWSEVQHEIEEEAIACKTQFKKSLVKQFLLITRPDDESESEDDDYDDEASGSAERSADEGDIENEEDSGDEADPTDQDGHANVQPPDFYNTVLARATSLFQCSCTPNPLHYKAFLAHFCVRARGWADTVSKCSSQRLGQTVARALLRRFGFADDTTLVMMQGLGRRFACACGQSVPQTSVGTDWLSLVQHITTEQHIFASVKNGTQSRPLHPYPCEIFEDHNLETPESSPWISMLPTEGALLPVPPSPPSALEQGHVRTWTVQQDGGLQLEKPSDTLLDARPAHVPQPAPVARMTARPHIDTRFYAPDPPSPDRNSYYGSEVDEFEDSDIGEEYVPDDYGVVKNPELEAWKRRSVVCVHCYGIGGVEVRIGEQDSWVQAHLRGKHRILDAQGECLAKATVKIKSTYDSELDARMRFFRKQAEPILAI